MATTAKTFWAILAFVAILATSTLSIAQAQANQIHVEMTRIGNQVTATDSNGSNLAVETMTLTRATIPGRIWSNANSYVADNGVYAWANPSGKNMVTFLPENNEPQTLNDFQDQIKEIWFIADGSITLFDDGHYVKMTRIGNQVTATDSNGSNLAVETMTLTRATIPGRIWSNANSYVADNGVYAWANPSGKNMVTFLPENNEPQTLNDFQDQIKEIWFIADGSITLFDEIDIPPPTTPFSANAQVMNGHTFCGVGPYNSHLSVTVTDNRVLIPTFPHELMLKIEGQTYPLQFSDERVAGVNTTTLLSLGTNNFSYEIVQRSLTSAGGESVIFEGLLTLEATSTGQCRVNLPLIRR